MNKCSSGRILCLICVVFFYVQPLAAQTKRALVVAIGDYKNFQSWKHISSISDLIYIRAGLNKFGFTPDHTDTIKNEQATKEAILDAFDRLTASSNTGDFVVF